MRTRKRLVLYTLFAFFLNFFWESWHGFLLYDAPALLGGNRYIPTITYVSAVDALILLAIELGGRLIWRERWGVRLTGRQYAYFAVTALLVALAIEVKAVYIFHQWAYSPLMPTIAGIGVSPLVQLAVTGLMARYAAGYFTDSRHVG